MNNLKINVGLIFFGLLFLSNIYAQKNEDAIRLNQLSYMKSAHRINCDSMQGSNLESRICLNLDFQKQDSILNNRFDHLLESIETDSIRFSLDSYQNCWIDNRHLQCKLLSDGWKGHMLGIYYLSCMVETTKRRIEEVENLTP